MFLIQIENKRFEVFGNSFWTLAIDQPLLQLCENSNSEITSSHENDREHSPLSTSGAISFKGNIGGTFIGLFEFISRIFRLSDEDSPSPILVNYVSSCLSPILPSSPQPSLVPTTSSPLCNGENAFSAPTEPTPLGLTTATMRGRLKRDLVAYLECRFPRLLPAVYHDSKDVDDNQVISALIRKIATKHGGVFNV